MKNWFKELNEIDVSKQIEKKNGLSYLPWAWAWTELKKRYPLSFAKVFEDENGNLFFRDPIGAHVKTSVTIVWENEDGTREQHEAIEYLPIMDFRNKAVPVENIDCMQINKTIQRSLTKCIARLGLGMYVYAGEDLPEESDDVKAQKEELRKELAALVKKVNTVVKKLTAEMDPTEKRAFGEKMIIPVIGSMDYTKCTDPDKLNELLAKLEG